MSSAHAPGKRTRLCFHWKGQKHYVKCGSRSLKSYIRHQATIDYLQYALNMPAHDIPTVQFYLPGDDMPLPMQPKVATLFDDVASIKPDTKGYYHVNMRTLVEQTPSGADTCVRQ